MAPYFAAGSYSAPSAPPAAARYQRGIHAPHLCGPYRQPAPRPQEAPLEADRDGEQVLRVYCDLDGVLADFNKGCLELFPDGGPIAEKLPTHTVTKLTYEEESEMWRRVESRPDFFLALPWMPDGEELWRWLDLNCSPPPAVLTGLPVGRAGQMASKQKEQWCRDKLGSHIPVFCCGTRNKQKFSGKNCVLVDDRGDLREAWEARGGTFVHHTSAVESIRQLREVLVAFHRRAAERGVAAAAPPAARQPLQLSSVCWAAQTPAGCFRANCRYLHVPISHRHRSWIQLWCFVWWNQRMFDDLDGLVRCVRAVYLPDRPDYGLQDGGMDEQSQGACWQMLETLRESYEIGLPFDFLASDAPARTPSLLPPLPWQVKSVLRSVGKAVREALGAPSRLVVAGSMGLGVDVDGSDLDLVLCCALELEPLGALRTLEAALRAKGEAEDMLLIDQATTPVLTFQLQGLSVDVAVNQMSSIRDALLFRYALRSSSPDLMAMLRLLKLWLKRRRLPVTKQGSFPTLVWVRMAIRFYQEQCQGPRRVARDWLRRFLAWAREGLPTGGAPLTVHGEQAESCSDRMAAGVPAATLLRLVLEIDSFLEAVAGGAWAAEAAGDDFPLAEPHANLCPVGPWDCHALVYVRGQGGASEVELCRVRRAFGGPRAELRHCTCERCGPSGGAQGERCVSYVSRRSREWLLSARREDPQRLRVQARLQTAGVQKRAAPAADAAGAGGWLLHPVHLVGQLPAGADPVRELERARQVVACLGWLPEAEPLEVGLCRGLLLAARRRALDAPASVKDVPCWSAIPVSNVYELDPHRRCLEEERARDEALARLQAAMTYYALRHAIGEELPWAEGSTELEQAEARLAAIEESAAAEGRLPPPAAEPPPGVQPGEAEDSDSEEEVLPMAPLTAAPPLALAADVPPPPPGRPPLDGLLEVVLERAAGELLGFSCEDDPADPALLRIVSISERGLLGLHNRSAAPGERVSEGSIVVAINGVRGSGEELRRELERERVALVVLRDRSHRTDDFGRRLFRTTKGPSTQQFEGVLRCRCNSQCKCGLADALGRAREAYGPGRSPWPALRVANLRPDVDEEALYRFFCSAGPVATVRVVRNTKTWESECHGFVNFRTFYDAERALATLDGQKIWGRPCYLSWSTRAQRGVRRPPPPPPAGAAESVGGAAEAATSGVGRSEPRVEAQEATWGSPPAAEGQRERWGDMAEFGAGLPEHDPGYAATGVAGLDAAGHGRPGLLWGPQQGRGWRGSGWTGTEEVSTAAGPMGDRPPLHSRGRGKVF